MFRKFFNRQASTAERDHNRQKRDQILTEIKGVELGQTMLDWAEENGVEVQLKKLSDCHGYCNKTGQKIVINSESSLVRSISTLVHELRHSWQIIEAKDPIYPKIDNGNLFASSITSRFMEADAFSFEDFFMFTYLNGLGSQEKAAEMLNMESEMIYNLADLKYWVEDNPTDVNIRRIAFDRFFESHLKHEYDQDMTVNRPIIEGWLKTKVIKYCVKPDPDRQMIKEESLIHMGQSAWGECAGQNFLEPDGKPFEMTNQHVGNFQKGVLNHLRQINTLPYYQGMNAIQMKNGQKRPLIKLD